MRLWHRFGLWLAVTVVLVVAVIMAIQFQPGGNLNPEPPKPCQLISSHEIGQAGGNAWHGAQSDPTTPGVCRWQASGVLLTVRQIDPDGQSFTDLRSMYARAASPDGTEVTPLTSSGRNTLFYYGSPPSSGAAKGVFAHGSRGDIVEIDVPAGRMSERGLDSLATTALKRLGDS